LAPQAPRFFSYSCHTCIPITITILQQSLGHQGKEGPQSSSVGWGGVKLDSGEKQCCLIKTLKALSLALSFASQAFSRHGLRSTAQQSR
jgi:hypothetical protein